MEKKNGFGMAFLFIVIGMLIAAIIGLSIWVYTLKKEQPKQESNTGVTDNNQNAESRNNEIAENENQIESNIPSEEELYGTYSWEKKFVNEYGNELDLKVLLVLNSDGTAKYRASSGYEAEYTKGTFSCKNGKIEYRREFYDYDNSENKEFTENNKIETFVIIDKNTLQSTYYDQTVTLVKTKNDFSDVEPVETSKQNDDISYSDAEIKECLQSYLDIKAALYSGPKAVIEYLLDDVEVYDTENIGAYRKTNIQYDEFKKAILSYMSEKEFEKMNPSDFAFKNIDGILYITEVGASGCNWRVDSIEKLENNSYIGHTTWMFEEVEQPSEFRFTIAENNGKCVIDSCESVKNK